MKFINSAQLTVTTTELHPVPVYTTWYHVAIDFVGPISHSLSGNRCAHIGDEFVCMCVCVCVCVCVHHSSCSIHVLYRHTDMLVLSFVRYILTLSDYFSKWVEAVATTSNEAHQISSALYKVCVL